MAAQQRYLIALGSNMPHHRHGRPADVVRAALAALAGEGLVLERAAPVIASAPLGPSRRTFANGAAVVRTALDPGALFDVCESLEARFGRRRARRWGARVLDIDIVLWSGGAWGSDRLTIPHASFRERVFVLAPAARIAADWRDPLTGLTVRQLHTRLTRPRARPT